LLRSQRLHYLPVLTPDVPACCLRYGGLSALFALLLTDSSPCCKPGARQDSTFGKILGNGKPSIQRACGASWPASEEAPLSHDSALKCAPMREISLSVGKASHNGFRVLRIASFHTLSQCRTELYYYISGADPASWDAFENCHGASTRLSVVGNHEAAT